MSFWNDKNLILAFKGEKGDRGEKGEKGDRGDVGSYSYNLFDESKAESGFLQIDGNTVRIVASDSYVTSDYIPVKVGQSISIMSHIRKVFFYDSEKLNPTVDLDKGTNGVYTTMASVDGFVRISFYVDDTTKMVVYGDTIDEYKPFEKQIEEGISFSNQQKDYIKENTVSSYNYNLFNPDTCESGYLQDVNIVASDSYVTTDFMPVRAGQSITIAPRTRKVYFYDISKTLVERDDTKHEMIYSATATQDGYVRISLYADDEQKMIVYGDSIADYVPFGVKLINEDVRLSNAQKEWVREESQKSNILYRKKYFAGGDSFTQGAGLEIFADGKFKGKTKAYPLVIGDRNDMDVINNGIGGSTLAYVDGSMNEFSTPNGRYTQIPSDIDYITLKFGINDSGKGVPIGTIDDTENTTFYGAWNIVLDYLVTNFPYAKIGVIVTNGTKGANALEYVTATINACKKWGIPYLNEATDEKIPLMLRSLRTDVCEKAKTLRDNAFSVSESDRHPNTKANEFEASIVEAWLRTL